MAEIIGADITQNTSTPYASPGDVFKDPQNKKEYVYVKIKADTTVANGTVVYNDYGTHFDSVTNDISDTTPNEVIGVGRGAITASYYGWIQTKGLHTAVLKGQGDSSNSIASGDSVIGCLTADGVCDKVALGTAPTYKVLGYCYSPATGVTDSTVAVELNCNNPST